MAVSSGSKDNTIELTARCSKIAWNPNYCLKTKVGKYIEIEGPLGTSFPIDNIQNKSLLLVGGGSGITPLRSVIKSLPRDVDYQLIYSTKTYEDLLYKKDVLKWIKRGNIISLTREQRDGNTFKNERVTSILENMEINDDSLVFVCGSPDLIKSAINLLLGKGLDKLNIFASMSTTALKGGPIYRADHPMFS